MDLLAALALVLVIEGLAIVIFARSIPELMVALAELEADKTRNLGLVCVVLGAFGYLLIRGGLGS